MLNKKENRAVVLGAVLGAVAGAGLALLLRRRRRPTTGQHRPVQAGQLLRLGSAVAAVVRQLMKMLG